MAKQTKQKRLKVSEIRKKLWKLQMELNKVIGINSLTSQYRIKVAYMLMWMRLIPINKRTLKGWSMPDMSTISEFTKEGGKFFSSQPQKDWVSEKHDLYEIHPTDYLMEQFNKALDIAIAEAKKEERDEFKKQLLSKYGDDETITVKEVLEELKQRHTYCRPKVSNKLTNYGSSIGGK